LSGNSPLVLLFLAVVACKTPVDSGDTDGGDTDGGDTDVTATGIAIAGSYVDDFGAGHDISDTAWVIDYGAYGMSTFALTQYDNPGQYAIGQNDTQNPYNPGLWSRFDWQFSGEDLYFCQTTFDAASEGDALAATPDTDLATGCGGFPWSLLTPS
jgi:hypothetical protein